MGLFKELQVEYWERGYGSAGERYICSDCLPDEALKAFVTANATANQCTYCGSACPSQHIAAPVDDVVGFIVEAIETEWEDANSSMHWDSAEGGFTMPTATTYDMLVDIGLGEVPKVLFDDMLGVIEDRTWCQRNPYSLTADEELFWGWQRFADFVKHQGRYFVMNTPFKTDHGGGIVPSRFLDVLAACIEDTGLIAEIPRGAAIYRVRVGRRGQRFHTAADLGSPPREKATTTNRMSPAGDGSPITSERKQNRPGKRQSKGRSNPKTRISLPRSRQPSS
jgi:hypothetical protein